MHYNFGSLAQREGFKDQLRVHGIRAGVANCIDPKASEATRGQALDHQNHDTHIKYQSVLKSLDIQALFYDLEPDYECRNMEQSMAHHRDPNAPQRLDAAAITAFEERDDIKAMKWRIAFLTAQIAGKPQLNEQLAVERTQLYNRKAKCLEAWKKAFIQDWWHSAYDEYVSGNEFTERDGTSLFNIYQKYLPEHARLRESLFTETSLDSVISQQCLEDIVALFTSTERVVYYPGLLPEENRCPICSKLMSHLLLSTSLLRKDYTNVTNLRRHFFDAHSIEETRSNCVSRKRKWQTEDQAQD
ncbi:hypothetical protein PENSUB_6108 [Penicillium subrubescens]|uniref:Uncharacterized protein n=1 Tax=Penicillium subrubescens TaxID=1316194 RepID=A0A1Q5U3V4_9EURO|nr:hypothetical protein PENSUB_6108 [Penicillium subrubescens]